MSPLFEQLVSDGEILHAAPYPQMLATSKEFQDLVNAHKETAGSGRLPEETTSEKIKISSKEICKSDGDKTVERSGGDQLIKKEEREVGDTGFKAYILYLKPNKGFLVFSFAVFCHLMFVSGQILQNTWMAAYVDDPNVTTLRLIVVYLIIGGSSSVMLLIRSILTVVMGMQSSRALFSQLLVSLFRAPMSFYDSTPLGRILSRVSMSSSKLVLHMISG